MSRRNLAIGAVIFDMDGVLVHSTAIHRQAFQEVLTPLGIPFEYNRFAGWRTSDVIRTVFRETPPPFAVDESRIAECARQKSLRSAKLMAEAKGSLAPGCVTVVQALADRFPLALASSGSRESVKAFLDHSQLRPFFRSILSGDDVSQAKPHPELFSRSIAHLETPAEQCLVLEDAVAGIQAARAAGATAVGMGQALHVELMAAGAREVIDSLEELPGLLHRWREKE